jgi:hypothetical protein
VTIQSANKRMANTQVAFSMKSVDLAAPNI